MTDPINHSRSRFTHKDIGTVYCSRGKAHLHYNNKKKWIDMLSIVDIGTGNRECRCTGCTGV